ncbi:MAG: carbohydrate kinase family protein [Lachnospiraceae bacterium]
MDKLWDVIIIGAAIVDLPLRPVSKAVFDVASYPVDGIAMTIGGDALNEATIMTRLGHKVGLMSVVGMDVPGQFVLNHCKVNHIDTTYIKKDFNIDTSINVGLVTEDGERTFITNRQGSLWKFKYDDLDMSALKNAKILSFASVFNNPLFDETALLSVFLKAKEEGMIICADMVAPRLGETLEDIKDALSYIDYFFPNLEEAREMTQKDKVEDIADVLLSYGIKCVIVKVGKKGSFIKTKKETLMIPGYPNSNCIDTIGAGDNFASGFISALAEGKTLRECGEFANAVASISVESIGAVAGVQSRKQADKRYELYKQVNSGKQERDK